MSENRNKSRVSFTKNLVVTESPRGCVSASVRGTDVSVSNWMDDELKARISHDDAKWREAMMALRERTVAEAKAAFTRCKG